MSYDVVVADTIPVAGAIVVAPGDELLVVEALPDSEAARSYKDVARHVYRFVQEVQWSGSGRAAAVRIVGEEHEQQAIAANVGLLLAPLADVAIASTPDVRVAFDLEDQPDVGEDHPTPRDKVWLVPAELLGTDEVSSRFGITFGPALGPGHAPDLVLIVMPADADEVVLPPADDLTEFAAVLVDAPDAHPAEIAIGPHRG